MKKAVLISFALTAAVFLLTGAGYAKWDGCGMGHGMGYGITKDLESAKKFQKETLELREEMMTKRLEIQSERSKDKPDTKRIATIRKEMIDLQEKIHEIAEKYGLEMPAKDMKGRGMKGKAKGKGMKGQGAACMECNCSCPCQ